MERMCALISRAGPSFIPAQKVFVDHTGRLWVLPAIPLIGFPWYVGVSSFDGVSWKLYNTAVAPTMASLNANNSDWRALSEDKSGTIWVGAPGGNVKSWNRNTDSWSGYCINVGWKVWDVPSISPLFSAAPCVVAGYSFCVGADSSGFLWICNYQNNYGCLICYDPRFQPDPGQPNPAQRHYRRFFPQSDGDNFMANPSALCAKRGDTIAVGSDNGRLIVFTYDGNPLADSISVISASSGFGSVYDLAVAPGGRIWAATLNGVYRSNTAYGFDKVDTLNVEARTIAAEDDSTIWIGTASAGVIQFKAGTGESRAYTMSNGLISNTVNSLSLDKKAGSLWIGTDNGVSKLVLGYTPGNTATGANMVVFPNPYSLSRDGGAGRAITFTGCPPGSVLTIYSMTGRPLARATPSVPGVYGGTILWKPGVDQVPGTYFFSLPKANSKVGKVLIIP
jgi:hypothetical protein